MEKIISLLNGTIVELDKLENELKNLNEEELGIIASSYPFNEYFHELITSLKKWKKDIEKS